MTYNRGNINIGEQSHEEKAQQYDDLLQKNFQQGKTCPCCGQPIRTNKKKPMPGAKPFNPSIPFKPPATPYEPTPGIPKDDIAPYLPGQQYPDQNYKRYPTRPGISKSTYSLPYPKKYRR